MTPDFVHFRRAAVALALSGSALLAGCSLGGDTALPPFTNPATVAYAASTGVTIAAMTRIDSTVYFQDVVVGTGRTIALGDSITAYYKGSLSSGSVFNSVARPGAPFTAVLDSRLIVGWTLGLPGMKTGGTRRLAVGPASGYRYSNITDQNTGALIIPSNSVLAFDVEIVSSVAKP